MSKLNSLAFLTVSTVFALPVFAADAVPSQEDMWQEIQGLKTKVESLQNENVSLENKLEATAQRVEQTGADEARVSIGGYGELHYNDIQGQDNSIDFHRFVLFFGYEFSDDVRFFSEVELEHALSGDGKPGEVELEQAYIDFDIADNHAIRAGQFLIPVGIINETHEPPTFYGVERNNVEKNIIPATWWEGGVAVYGQLGEGVSYDLAFTSGLAVDPTNFKIRSGRQKVAKASSDHPALTARLKYTGVPGVEVSGTLHHQSDLTQGLAVDEASANLIELHTVINRGSLGLRALYAMWDIDGSEAEVLGADEQEGWYIEPSYRISPQFGVFLRFSEWDNKAGNSTDTAIEQTDIGVNYWPVENVVVKLDYQDQTQADRSKDAKGINIGLGYQF